MANSEHLNILNQGVDVWNKWRRANYSIKPDLSNATLSNTSLKISEIKRIDFLQKDMSDFDFCNTDLSGTNLYYTDLSNVNFNGATLVDANLNNTLISKTSFINANLENAKLKGTQVKDSSFLGANLDSVDFNNADIFTTNFNGVSFNKTNFSLAKLGMSVFAFTDLSDCIKLDSIVSSGDCSIDFYTLKTSSNLPKEFLFKIGLPDNYINYLPDFYEEPGIKLFPVFLSHAHKDKEFAVKLYEALTKRKVRVWFDERELMPGDNLTKGLHKGINLYDKFILVCSEHSLKNSYWVDDELKKARKKKEKLFKELGEDIDTIIPITIDDFIFDGWESEKKDYLTDYIIGDFKNWQDDTKFELALDNLVKALNVDRNDDNIISYLK